ncbi:hypothetical protein HY990_06630 [Candidatus Micrarchaeota archaeon]|nr:hypothetical protein [Candidatus Micrarchaeota archaeon]
MNKFYVIEPCTTANGLEIKLNQKQIDIGRAKSALEKEGEVFGGLGVVLLAKYENYSLSIYQSGRIMVKSDKKLKTTAVESFASRLISLLEKEGALI